MGGVRPIREYLPLCPLVHGRHGDAVALCQHPSGLVAMGDLPAYCRGGPCDFVQGNPYGCVLPVDGKDLNCNQAMNSLMTARTMRRG